MKKILTVGLSLCMIVVCGIVLAACGGNGNTGNNGIEEKMVGKWSVYLDGSAPGDPADSYFIFNEDGTMFMDSDLDSGDPGMSGEWSISNAKITLEVRGSDFDLECTGNITLADDDIATIEITDVVDPGTLPNSSPAVQVGDIISLFRIAE